MSGSILASLARVAGHSDARKVALTAALIALSDEIRAGRRVRRGADPAPIDFFELSRHLFYAAISMTDNERDARTKRAAAGMSTKIDLKEGSIGSEYIGWQYLLKPYNKLYKEAKGALCLIENDDALRKYARLESRGNGSTRKGFYASLAILIISLHEQGKLATPRFQLLCPNDELDFPDRALRVVDAVLATVEGKPLGAAAPRTAKQSVDAASAPEIWIKFPYAYDKLAELTEFQSTFRFGPDSSAHFAIYRPSRKDPKVLIKSYLEIKRPVVDGYVDLAQAKQELAEDAPEVLEEQDADIFDFRHFYRPSGKARERISEGRALPLDQGLYLVGGQRIQNRKNHFDALKVIALPWKAIAYAEQVVRGIALSTNLEGFHLASRIAVRATPITDRQKLRLGHLPIEELLEDLRRDAKAEHALIAEATTVTDNMGEVWRHDPALSAEQVEKQIKEQSLEQFKMVMTLCNNLRRYGWSVEPGYFHGETELDDDMVDDLIKRALDDGERFVRMIEGKAEPFSFAAFRVGVLTHD